MFEEGHRKVGGRVAGTPNKVSLKLFNEFMESLKKVEAEKGISFFEHIIRQGFDDPKTGVAILRKLR